MKGKVLNSALKLTLAIIKPDVFKNPTKVQEIRNIILDNQFYFVRSTTTKLSLFQAETFYQEHQKKFFFKRLTSFMSSGPISAHILAHEDAIELWRRLLGPTNVYKAQFEEPNSLRAQFGLSDTRNGLHGADSHDSAIREMAFFFPEFDISKWYKEQEPFFRKRLIELDTEKWEHMIIQNDQK